MRTKSWSGAMSVLLVGAIFSVILGAGCERAAAPAGVGDAAPLELRSYALPEGAQQEAVAIVRQLLDRGKDAPRLGSAVAGPGGQLMVTAPASFQAGVADFVEHLRTSPPSPPPTISLEYWLVFGRPLGAGADPGKATDLAAFDPALMPALKAIAKANGPMQLAPGPRVKIAAISGDWASAEDRGWQIKQRATVAQGALLAEVRIQPESAAQLETRVQFKPDQLVVLGYAGVRGKAAEVFGDEDAAEGSVTAFYVVRGSLAALGE